MNLVFTTDDEATRWALRWLVDRGFAVVRREAFVWMRPRELCALYGLKPAALSSRLKHRSCPVTPRDPRRDERAAERMVAASTSSREGAMSLSISQDKFYWRLWSQLRKAQPGVDRKAVHAQLGLPESHTDFRNADFDKWKGHVLAAAQPANYRAQVQQLKMPAIRKRVFIGHILDALQRPEEYAEAILAKMERVGSFGFPKKSKKWTPEMIGEKLDAREAKAARQPSLRTLDTADEVTLGKVMVALKIECRREWRTKDDLLSVIGELRRENDFDERHVADAVCAALCWEYLPPLAKMYYEPLLVVLAVLRRMASGEPALEPAGVDEPF